MHKSLLSTSLFLAIVITFTTNAAAQSDGIISGTVKDSTGAAVAGAAVTIVNPVKNLSQKATTNEDGIFVSPQLPPGTYTISVEKAGFKKIEKTNIILSTADKLNVGDFVLDVGDVSETIQVQADVGQLQIKTESGERSDLITNRQIRDIALNGRNILDLTKTLPGLINTTQRANSTVTNAGGDFTVNGVRSTMHEITVDGATNSNLGNNTGLLVTVNPDAVQEVKILSSNYQAEYGRAGGGFVQITTKSGSNQFHATGRYFRRHDSLNANSFFNNANNRPRNIYRYNFYGYDVSGPVYLPRFGEGGSPLWDGRNKLFFFWGQEYYRQLVPESARNIRVPTAAERAGDFSQTVDGSGNKIYIKDPALSGPCNATNQSGCFSDGGVLNKIPASRFYSNGQAILNLYPLPNVSGRNDFNYTSQRSSEYPRREDILRIDYQVTERTRLNGRFIRNQDEQLFSYGTTTASFNWPLTFTSRKNGPGYTFGFTLNHTFTPTLVNELNYSPSKGGVHIAMVDDNGTRSFNGINVPLLFPDANPDGILPNFQFDGIANQTFPTTVFQGSPFDQAFMIHTVTDNLTKVWGNHTIKTGIYFQRASNRRTSFTDVQANINFGNDANNPFNTGYPFANALLGIFNTYQQASVKLNNDFVYNNIEGYIQDTWKITPRLTLDYGIRLSYYQPIYDQEGQLGFFNPELFDPAKAVRIYAPVCVNNSPCPSGANRRAIDPAALVPGFMPTANNTLPGAFIGLIVPNSGDISNGIGRAANGYPAGGFKSDPVLPGPRFGFAYDLTGRQKTVIRGGFGITYDRINTDVIADAIANLPNVSTPRLVYGHLDDIPGLRNAGGTSAISNAWGVDQSGNLPTVYTYSLGVQHNLGWGTAIDVAYVGTLGRHLVRQYNLNAIPYGTTFTAAAQDATLYAGGIVPSLQPNLPSAYSQAGLNFTGQMALPVDYLRPYPGYGTINFRGFDATSNYNSLQVALNRRFSRGLTFGVAYTFSKTLTTANDINDVTSPFNTRAFDYKLANFDRSHVLVINYVYDLPGLGRRLGDKKFTRAIFNNWQLSGISQFVSGTPLELDMSISGVNTGQRITGSYTEAPRFYLKDNPGNGANGLQLDPASFVVPGIGDVGPYPRTYARNPSWLNHDVSLFKNFPLGGGEGSRYLQLRFEFFNIFNSAQFTGINTGTNLAVPLAGG
ncbi:MAG: carboxypeptidase regulatory-like domain-containing protein, partial [Blastocatellia bacterium]|nr:carboxypeptidase regulatory-like domain-containing protein [Blastocatellia bacterium]